MKTGYVLLLTLAVVLFAAIPVSDTADAEQTASGNISWNCVDHVSIRANDSQSFSINIYNLSATDTVHISLSTNSVTDVHIKLDNSSFTLSPSGTSGDRTSVTVKLNSEKYASENEAELVISMSVYDMTAQSSEISSLSVDVSVSSLYANGSCINKIMGLFENPLAGNLGEIPVTASVTLFIWIAISALASSVVRIVCQYAVERAARMTSGSSTVDRNAFKKTWKYVFGIVIMYGIANTMSVMGVGSEYIGTFRDFTDVLTILFIAMTVWHVYTTVSNILSFKLSDGDEESSLKPLVLLLGRIVIIITTLLVILSIYGISLGSIVVALGLGMTGLSFGAKTVITQFFCGVQTMILRTFRTGDKIRIGSDTTTLIIKEVGVMATKCKNWSNEEVIYVPNSTLSDTKIINITKDNVFYRVYDYYTIGFASDISRAREIMVECASMDDGVIADGSFPKPDVRFIEVTRSEISLRLAYTVIDHEDYGTISARIRMAIFKKFNEEGIDIPYPQYTVNMIGTETRGNPDAQ